MLPSSATITPKVITSLSERFGAVPTLLAPPTALGKVFNKSLMHVECGNEGMQASVQLAWGSHRQPDPYLGRARRSAV